MLLARFLSDLIARGLRLQASKEDAQQLSPDADNAHQQTEDPDAHGNRAARCNGGCARRRCARARSRTARSSGASSASSASSRSASCDHGASFWIWPSHSWAVRCGASCTSVPPSGKGKGAGAPVRRCRREQSRAWSSWHSANALFRTSPNSVCVDAAAIIAPHQMPMPERPAFVSPVSLRQNLAACSRMSSGSLP
jgi:hypothetical protein